MNNWNFQNGLEGWTKTGTAFNSQPTYGNNVLMTRENLPADMPLGGTYWRDQSFPIGLKEPYWIGTYEKRPNASISLGTTQGDRPTGTLTSDSFVIEKRFITFLIGGGRDLENLKIELLLEQQNGAYRAIKSTARTGFNTDVMRREWWPVARYLGRKAKIKITDNSSRSWGHINIANITFQNQSPLQTKVTLGSRSFASVKRHQFVKNDSTSFGYVDWDAPLWGFVDMHSHPAAHLGFGEQLLYGGLDGDPKKVLNNCNAFHGGWGLDNLNGNYFREAVVSVSESKYKKGWKHKRKGYPDFEAWPAWHSVTHQQMWIMSQGVV